jgi:hypothetical protein
MAVFKNEPEDWERLDFSLLYKGPVHLYQKPEDLQRSVIWLARHGYQPYDFDCTTWENEETALQDLYETLDMPYRLSANLNAFSDNLSDFDIPQTGGAVFIFRRLDDFATREPRVTWDILDIIAEQARCFLLTGRCLITLAQSDDTSLHFEKFGGTGAYWHNAVPDNNEDTE